MLVVAKNNLNHAKISKQLIFIKKIYQCLIWGLIRPLKGKIETLISRDKFNRQLMSVNSLRGKILLQIIKPLKHLI